MIFTKFLLKIYIIFLVFISFFTGFFLRENSAGGGKSDFNAHTWPVIQSFKNDFFYTIENYGLFYEGSYPLSHIINAYLNPFSNDIINFQFSITVLSFVIFLILALALKKNFPNLKKIDIFLTSSVILILPFFRTSAYWGLTENFGWLFLVLSLYFFLQLRNNISNNPTTKDIKNVVFFCFISACGIYARQTLIFLPISYLFFLILNNANRQILIISIILYILFSIPGFLLIFTWGGIYDIKNFPSPIENYFSYKFLLQNIPIISSLVAFYLFPIIFIEILNEGIKNFYHKYFKIFIVSLISYLVLSQLNLLSYLSDYTLSGGVILKTNYLIKDENYFLVLLFSSLGLSILFRIINENIKNNLIILLPSLLIYCFSKLLYQEYVEPLILIIFFLAINTKLQDTFFKKPFLSNIIIITYFSIYLIGAIYIKHFASF